VATLNECIPGTHLSKQQEEKLGKKLGYTCRHFFMHNYLAIIQGSTQTKRNALKKAGILLPASF
jgi:hypothetical protein